MKGIALLTLVVLLSACAPTQEVSIGAIQALTGESSPHGLRVKQGIDLAVEDINLAGGINGKPLRIIYEDSACNQPKGVSAALKLIGEGIPVIIGPTCSSVSMAVAPLAEEARVIMITPVSSVPALKDAGDYIFRNRVPGGPHGILMAEFAINELGAKTAGVIYINLDNGVGYKDAFVERFEALGGDVRVVEAYEKGTLDFRAHLAKIKNANPDVLFLAGQAHENAVKQAAELEVESQIIGPITIQSAELIDIAGEAAEGIFYSYSAFDPESSQPIVAEYQRKYAARYGKKSEAFAANAYDATMLIANGLRQCGKNTDCIRDYLYSVEKYPGVGGITTFDAFGEVTKPLIIKTIKDGEFVPNDLQ